tara:strand:+ start:60 stop:686 length:627 start_codon:yes stop_codon:yes gene_type:complete
MELPILYLDFDELSMNEGMEALSFVDSPATKIEWKVFNKIEEYKFVDYNEEKRIVTSPVMLAETPIMRFTPELGRYYVKFSKPTILKMMTKYFKDGKIHKMNLNHDPKQSKKDVYMIESYIVGDRNKSELFPDIPDGSWVASFKVENDEVWNEIKSGSLHGFSIEGFFIEKYENQMIETMLYDIKIVMNSNETESNKERKIKKLLNLN